MKINPILKTDYPDVDAIRVGSVYYMVSTTMHFMPGCVILRSYNLVDWEILTYVYETLELTDGQCMRNHECIYGQGMWAASLRYHEGIFYICFAANDTGKTYLFRSGEITGPWERSEIEGFYHDSSLLFDDDGRVYIAYGNRQIYITELKPDLTGPKPGGLHKMVVEDTGDVRLGYEGTHFYKIEGRYYLFFIHWGSSETARRAEACFVSEKIDGPYRGGDVLDDDRGYGNQGVAQGGIVDTPDGRWFGLLFQDSGAVGRIPVLVPVRFENGFPVFGEGGRVPDSFEVPDNRPGYQYAPLYGGDDFTYEREADGRFHLKLFWQWNHVPECENWDIDRERHRLCLTAGRVCRNVTQAVNVLTQRLMYPGSEVAVTVHGGLMRDGDVAGLCLLQGDYGYVGIQRMGDGYAARMFLRPSEKENAMAGPEDDTEPAVVAETALREPCLQIRVLVDFEQMGDRAEFEIFRDGEWVFFGPEMKLYFKLDHFCGVRAGLFCYGTKTSGGRASFADFTHRAKPSLDISGLIC